ncbi:MAG: hypothetical protein AAF492_28600, partial [Verrucomicrobiota bacterium]
MNATPTTTVHQIPDIHLVGIGETKFSRNPDATLVTYTVGYCLAIAAFDTDSNLGGLLHCKRPAPDKDNPEEARENPHLTIETGMP